MIASLCASFVLFFDDGSWLHQTTPPDGVLVQYWVCGQPADVIPHHHYETNPDPLLYAVPGFWIPKEIA